MRKAKNFYVVYNNDDEDSIICCGNIHEVAKYLGIKERSVRFRTTPTYKRRRAKSKNKLDRTLIFSFVESQESGEK